LAVVYRSTARRYARSRDVEREYVCDVRRLRASRLNDDEIGRDDADRNGPSRLKRHGRGIRNSVTSDLRRTHASGKRKKWAIFLPALPEPGEGELCTCTLGTRRRGSKQTRGGFGWFRRRHVVEDGRSIGARPYLTPDYCLVWLCRMEAAAKLVRSIALYLQVR